MAFYADKTPGRFLQYSASVVELGAKAAETSPKENLTAFKFALRKDEISRQEIEHGPRKLPGLDIVSQQAGKFRRERVIASGQRLYEVGVTARSEEALSVPDVKNFIDSFGVDE
jgi:hypothetical protein